ncbi:TniQ family protein [Leptolyngbya sp. Cla-17]|uniref:TniQ family protein n=1 Tax=Leptolyngbya sp. Cla-17 TaxID=2803751 RepID=UPI0039F50DCF
MIGCFPDPYPDEILYSIYARYKERMLYLDDTAIYKLVFGARHNRPQLPYDEDELDYLVSELQPGYSYSVARLKCEHTLTPIYKLGWRCCMKRSCGRERNGRF